MLRHDNCDVIIQRWLACEATQRRDAYRRNMQEALLRQKKEKKNTTWLEFLHDVIKTMR